MAKPALSMLSAVIAIAAATAGHAQDNGAAPSPEATAPAGMPPSNPAVTAAAPARATPSVEAGTQEIVVTALRRRETLLSVPLSISAATGEQLQNQGIREISSLQFTTPGLVPNNGSGYVQVFIRGVGNTIFVGADPSVATFVDDVPRIYGSMINNFVNVERVEVLKGAQGGLYGRNATGGVINIITHQPTDELDASGVASYGSHNTIRGAAYVNVPIAEGVAWNISGERDSHDGYIRNLLNTSTPYTAAMFPGGTSSPLVCGSVGCHATSQQTADFFNSSVHPPKRLNHSNFYTVDSKLRLQTGNLKVTIAGDYSKKDDDSGNEYADQNPDRAVPLAEYILHTFGVEAQLPANFYGTPQKFAAYRSFTSLAGIEDYGVSATAVLALHGLDLTSISAFRWNTSEYDDDQTGNAPTVLTADVTNKKRYFYQEVRAVSNSSGRLQYLFGGSYLNTHVDGNSVITYFPPLFAATPTTSTGGVENWSVYGQVGYDLTSRLNLTASGRYIHESNSVTFSSPVAPTTSISAHKFLPAATLSYKVGGGTIYVRYAKGFKAGGVNTVDPPNAYPTNLGKVFSPEQVDTYEGGVRIPLFDRKVQLTTAVFYNDYKGLQTFTNGNATHPGIIFAVVNAGSARSYGAEANVNWQVAKPLSLGFNVGYLNAKYKTFANTDGTVFNTFDFSGRSMLFSPKWQVGLNGNLDQPITDRLNLTGSALAAYTDDVKFFNSSTPGLPDPVQPAYWLVNARVGIKTADNRYQLAVFANNLFDKGYFTSGNAGGFGNQLRWGDPRIVGVEFKVNWK